MKMQVIFDRKIDYYLENERVILRPLLLSDYDNLAGFAINEPDTWKYSLVSAAGEDGMRKYIDFALEQREQGKCYAFIIYDKLAGKYAGCTRFYEIEPVNKSMLLGYTWYGKEFRGTGLNKQCKFLLLEFAFEKLCMERIEFRADNNNALSIAAMKSIGCIEEGVFRNHLPDDANGGRKNTIVLSILKQEWENGGKEKLLSKIKEAPNDASKIIF
jgi:N-acetyltransferase